MPLDASRFADALHDTVADYLRRLLEPLWARLVALEARKPDPGVPGRDGRDGLPGAAGERGSDGVNGVDGRDGRDGSLGLPGGDGLDGKNGRDGVDGLGFDDLELTHDGERGFTFRFARGDRVKEWTFALPCQIYRGVYAAGAGYVRGDTVTWGGSLYHCNEPTADKPGEGAKGWTLAVKRGADGREGKAGRPGERGVAGPSGRDYTRLGPGGEKL